MVEERSQDLTKEEFAAIFEQEVVESGLADEILAHLWSADNADFYEVLAKELPCVTRVLFGATKVVLYMDDVSRDWCIKLPFVGSAVWSDELDEYMTYDENKYTYDYCEIEATTYEMIQVHKPSIAKMFAGTFYCSNLSKLPFPVYVSERMPQDYITYVDPGDFDEEVYDRAKSLSDSMKEYIAPRYLASFIEDWGYILTRSMVRFMDQWLPTWVISDICCANIGRNRDGKAVVLDYSGIMDEDC